MADESQPDCLDNPKPEQLTMPPPLRPLLAAILVSLVFSSPSPADVKLPNLFSDHMLLQQSTAAPIWGWAEPGEAVRVAATWGKDARTKTDQDGRWKVFLPTPAHGGPYQIKISGRNERTLDDVMIGEVWLCAGQSNLGWRLSATYHGKEDGATANHPNLRIFRSERQHSPTPLDDCKATWTPCTPESAATCSAVSFYFARKVHSELKVPVGIIVQPYAGTPIEGWMPKEIQLDDTRTRSLLESMDGESANYDPALAEAQLARAMERWKNGERRGKPVLRQPSNTGHQYPGNIFHGMIHPIRPYAIRGAIWYQGERNAKDLAQAQNYQRQLTLLIDYYRRSWHHLSKGAVARDFPFYFVQLPSWHPPQSSPVEDDAAWAVSREMMRRVGRTVPNTGMAVSIDTGDPVLLHPLDKRPIGLRLAYLALGKTYDKPFVATGPAYESIRRRGSQLIVTFHPLPSGLVAARPGPLDSFAIAGTDRRFAWADATIEKNTVVLSAAGISEPVAVRYAWAMNPSRRILLYNREGLPASPFRSDSWPLFDSSNYAPAPQAKPKSPDNYRPTPLVRPPVRQ